jgi:aryl sulfotransferase
LNDRLYPFLQYFLDWLDRDGYPLWPFWEHIASWWTIRDLPNLMLIHFEELRGDLPAQMRRIACFLDIPIDEARFPAMVEHCSFAWMKANATKVAPLGGAVFDGGAEVFINKGTNGRWRDMLTKQDIVRYETMAREQLGEECALWLATGQRDS